MRVFISIILIIPLLIWLPTRIVKSILFDRNCEGYLKRAADANTIEKAKKELDIAIKYMEENNLTNGYTSVIYNTPDEDVEFWYTNLKESRVELNKISENATQLEKSNMLMKLRETLVDQDSDGVEVTVPPGIDVHPYNITWFWIGWIGFVCFVIAVINIKDLKVI